MLLSIPNLLSSEEVDTITKALKPEDFIDGKKTAGWAAKRVKQNTQLSTQASYAQDIKAQIKAALKGNLTFQSAVKPKAIHSILISRYEAGMSYGAHVDNALMSGNSLRSDVSLTLFLNSPSDYEGGELVIEEISQNRLIKLDAGSVITYPSSTLHRIKPVTQGVRLVAVAWVHSLVRDPAKREILFELDQARRSIFNKDGKTREFNWITKSYTNLLRQWADV
ncbi:Fe2+-dependent dioxygenase [Acaryochloris sp. IP29b_bin.137]|uniref:Fe2+-dependent dioxygenase n=1 Tax=Acaryochloris sp. IP29b_bin.137 TaxID=2969217 RepID=UPI00260B2AE7|nr:Fe2+-dependent dioxygenase [Acaryochloris sp. IP29b_bin.137]